MLSKYIRKDKQFMLNFTAVIGVGLTMLTTVRATTKACKLINEDMTTQEKIKKTWRCYIPPSLIASSTMLCIMYSDHTTMNQKISLLNALVAVQDKHKTLKNSVNHVCNNQTKEDIVKQTIRDKVPKDVYLERTDDKIFYEEYTCKFFTSPIDNVLKAEYLFNKQLSIIGHATLNDFYELLGISKTEAGEFIGWSVYDGYFGANPVNPWVDFDHSKMEDDDGCEYYYLNYANQPEVISTEF